MRFHKLSIRKKVPPLRGLGSCLFLLSALGISGQALPHGYVGDSFMKIPGVDGSWIGDEFGGWIRAESHYWPDAHIRVFSTIQSFEGNRMTFSGPGVPKPGKPSSLVLALNKKSPDAVYLNSLCESSQRLPEIRYAESSELSRAVLEVAPRPAEVPEYWEFKLKDARVSECPVASGAPEQAFVIEFADIEWLNFDPEGPDYIEVKLRDDELPEVRPATADTPGQAKAFVVSWFGVAGLVSEDQCPVMNTRPEEEDYFALLSEDEVVREKEAAGEKGIDYMTQMGFRGPGRLSAVNLPGIVPDPGFAEPVSEVAYGVDLDSGNACVTAESSERKSYRSLDGKLEGVDNQLYTVVGCFAGFRGKEGYRNQTSNARRADGNVTMLIEVSRIDDEMNDDDVDVKIIYSMDPPVKDPSGSTYLPYSTFRPSKEQQFAYFNTAFKGRIVDGVVMTYPLADFELNSGLQDPLVQMKEAQLRLEMKPDGSLQGVLGGYLDWRRFMSFNRSSYSENLFGYQAPGLYNALKRNADGLKNPVTGQCDGISAAYEIEGVAAFISPAQ